MARPFLTIIAVLIAVMILTALSIRSRQKKEEERIRRTLKEGWGHAGGATFSSDYFAALKAYAASRDKDGEFALDEITWQDLDLDRLYQFMASTYSSCGDAALIDRLRHPLFENDKLAEFDRLACYFAEDETSRLRIQTALCEIGRPADRTLSDELNGVGEVAPIGKTPYAVLAAATLLDLVFLFIMPLAAVLIFIALTAFNIVLALRMKERLSPAIRGFQAALRLMKGAEDITDMPDSEVIRPYADRLRKALGELRGFKAGSSLVTGRSRYAEGLGEAILQYVNLLLHLDLLKFDQMQKAFTEHEEAVMTLHEVLGQLDMAQAAASLREALPVWCVPEIAEDPDPKMSLDVRTLMHPLIKNAVPVTVCLEGGLLITGSNASGKSTFLKEMAVGALMAQAAATVAAESYRAPFLRIMTSMALSDDLESGESYYIVEIRSIRRILQAIGEGKPCLVAVDEVLKGTNTIERIAASSEILKAMRKPNALILAATHDRELTAILKDIYVNKHFEESVQGEDILFTYELMDGPASTRNAIRLLEAEGYDRAIVEGARKAAERFEETGEWTQTTGSK